ncbi:hypothetical protein ACP275_14G233800 [Erythranthe tilingii]
MWSSAAAASRHMNCGLPPEFFFVAPASSFQHHHHSEAAGGGGGGGAATINFDHHSLGVGVIPLLTATPCIPQTNISGGGGAAAADEELLNNARNRGGGGGGMQLWQHHQHQAQNSSAYLLKPMSLEHTNLLETGCNNNNNNGGIGGSSSSMGTATCQDCGNQAKKDCPHRRCRTCCKSRGYDCSTHVKSTWVPAARRRERQLISGDPAAAGSSQSTNSGTKKPRLGGASQTTTASHTSTSNNTPPRSFDTTSSHQDGSYKESLPGQVRAPAVFKCVRVTALDDGEDEYAYQAVVRIGGHVFKGFLYDQGVDGRDGLPNLSELHLGGGGRGGSAGGNGGRNNVTAAAVIDHSDHMYAASGSGLLGGSGYGGNPIN